MLPVPLLLLPEPAVPIRQDFACEAFTSGLPGDNVHEASSLPDLAAPQSGRPDAPDKNSSQTQRNTERRGITMLSMSLTSFTLLHVLIGLIGIDPN
jgi:hypothetical protein